DPALPRDPDHELHRRTGAAPDRPPPFGEAPTGCRGSVEWPRRSLPGRRRGLPLPQSHSPLDVDIVIGRTIAKNLGEVHYGEVETTRLAKEDASHGTRIEAVGGAECVRFGNRRASSDGTVRVVVLRRLVRVAAFHRVTR